MLRAKESSFHFRDPIESVVNGKTVIILQADLISKVQGSCKGLNGNDVIIYNYTGPIKVYEENIHDNALMWEYGVPYWSRAEKKDNKVVYPHRGYYYKISRSNLIVDIDECGELWLTDRSFYMVKLIEKLDKLEVMPQDEHVQEAMEEIYNELQELIHYGFESEWESNRAIDQHDQYYSSMQDDLNLDELGRMNSETDGFWRY